MALILGTSTTCTASLTADDALPVDQIEAVLGLKSNVSHGVLDISVPRTDIGSVQRPRGVTFTSSLEIHGDIFFQPLPCKRTLMNGDMALKEDETNPFISALRSNDIVFQAFHQHLPMHPQVWFQHYRAVGDPIALAKAIRVAIGVTSTPLPQQMSSNPTTPLDPDRLAKILHGDATVGDDGVVTVTVPRRHGVRLGGVYAQPQTGVSTNIEFNPERGSRADVVPDFSMEAGQVDPVVDLMLRRLDWYQGCLYNQETAEHPQLYFDHMLKTGDAYELAHQIRHGLDLTDAQ